MPLFRREPLFVLQTLRRGEKKGEVLSNRGREQTASKAHELFKRSGADWAYSAMILNMVNLTSYYA